MRYTFREHHLFQILETFSKSGLRLPLDRFLSGYFRKNRSVGSKDRKEICQTIYDMIRWKGTLDHLAKRPLTWQSRHDTYKSDTWKQHLIDNSLPPHIRISFPKEFYDYLIDALGEERAFDYCLVCNEAAPTTVRVNTMKISRKALLKKWEGLFDISPTTYSPLGITFHKKINFFAQPEFKEGLFEIQDEGSQLLAELMEVGPDDQVLDYCAGSAGKALAFASRMEGKGQIYIHDIRDSILIEAKKRLKRAGIQNAQLLHHMDTKKRKLKGKMDWILVDAPCSGSGTLRRNPDMKWKFDIESIERLVKEQQAIFENALTFLKEDGKIVYSTCSVFPQENEHQVALFEEKFSLRTLKKHHSFPKKGGMDGFFGAVLSR